MSDSPFQRLVCGVETKAWGKVGHKSLVAKFAKEAAPGLSIEECTPYAELWMGTYPSNPSKSYATGESLEQLIRQSERIFSPLFQKRNGNRLPFLLKVLSIARPLSIQAHPNKRLAEELHASQPERYPDDNHKPEMVIALSEFSGLCGLRPLSEVVHFLKSIPALPQLVGKDATQRCFDAAEGESDDSNMRATLAVRSAFEAILKADEASLRSGAKLVVEDAKRKAINYSANGDAPSQIIASARLILLLNGQFPGDVGLLTVFFLKHIHLAPGEAIFLKADTIHAHLSGDIIECMAASDNVLRAGLTPNYKDIDTFVQVLNSAVIEDLAVVPIDYDGVLLNETAKRSGSYTKLYNPAAIEFSVVQSFMAGKASRAMFEAVSGPSLVLCTAGLGKISVGPYEEEMREGSVYFLHTATVMSLTSLEHRGFTVFIAFCDLEI